MARGVYFELNVFWGEPGGIAAPGMRLLSELA